MSRFSSAVFCIALSLRLFCLRSFGVFLTWALHSLKSTWEQRTVRSPNVLTQSRLSSFAKSFCSRNRISIGISQLAAEVPFPHYSSQCRECHGNTQYVCIREWLQNFDLYHGLTLLDKNRYPVPSSSCIHWLVSGLTHRNCIPFILSMGQDAAEIISGAKATRYRIAHYRRCTLPTVEPSVKDRSRQLDYIG